MKKLYGLTVSIFTIILSIAIAEVFLRTFSPISDPYEGAKRPSFSPFIPSQFYPNLQLIVDTDEGLPHVLHGKHVFKTNNMGFRGNDLAIPKPMGEFRIFLVGGSTFECFNLDDSQGIHGVLQAELNKKLLKEMAVSVYNAGKSGDSSDDHVAMIVHRLVHLQPDLIVVFAGINDLGASIRSADPLHYGRGESEGRVTFSRLIKMTMTEFELGKRLYYITQSLSARTNRQVLETVRLKSNLRERVRVRKEAPVSNDSPRTELAPYRANLTTISGVTKAHGIRLLFMTQPSSWSSSVDPTIKDWHWMLYQGGIAYREAIMETALASFNQVMSEVAAERGVPILDLAKVVPKSTEFFVDDVHFTVNGAYKVGTTLATAIIQQDFLRQPDKR